MKFLHISDLHIGKRINEFSMLEDQKYILDKIVTIAEREQAEGVLLAGDIYDKTVPSAEAVQVFDRFLTGLAKRKIKVFAVSGNHDSPERIAFGAELMKGKGVYLSPVYDGRVAKVALEDTYGKLYVHLLPFVKPATVRHGLEVQQTLQQERSNGAEPSIQRERSNGTEPSVPPEGGSAAEPSKLPESYNEAVRAVVERMEVDADQRNILVAHQFVTGASRCESEETAVGGLDNVDADLFDAFDYVALGHIHSPQHVGRDTLRYCGTPLKYSFSEAEQEKSVTVVELREKGEVELRQIPLTPLRDMRRIRGTYMEVMDRNFYQGTNREDYVQITLTDEEDVPDGLQRLRKVYPNLMRLVYDNARTRQSREVGAAEELERKSELELFSDFYVLQNNQTMSAKQTELVRQLIQESMGCT
ncbi:exonuclease SbcCD subunit D [bacterium D16-50]|nr:exonuclease SbcCD subunit D [bacterium D16-50]